MKYVPHTRQARQDLLDMLVLFVVMFSNQID